jgi:hypothetical protein
MRCNCGSGAHPRHCLVHPTRFDEHVKELNIENLLMEIEGLEKQIECANNLLAVIHRDGGHYTGEHGFEKSCRDAEAIVAPLVVHD